MKVKLLGLVCLLAACGHAFATTYYVSSSGGSNANNGTSTGTPWQTTLKANAGPYAPGDSVLFKCGDTWSGSTISTPSAGVSGSQITYGNYGACTSLTLPVIDAGGATNVVHILKNYITIQGLQLQNSSGQLIEFGGMTGTQILSNVTKNGGAHVFHGRSLSGILTCSTLIDGNAYTVDGGHTSSQNMIEIWTQPGCQITVTNNNLNRINASGVPGGSGIVVPGASGAILNGNTIRGGIQGIGVKPYQRASDGANCNPGDPGTDNIQIIGNYIDHISTANNGDGELIEGEGCSTTLEQTNLTVAQNILICQTGGVGVGSSDAIGAYHNNGYNIYGNVIMGGCQSGWPADQTPTSAPGMIRINAASTNVYVHNNTFVGAMPAGDTRPQEAIGFFPGSAGSVENNIFKHVASGVICVGCGAVSGDYNLSDTDVGTMYGSGITHNGGHDKPNTSPQFVSGSPTSANDVKLQAGSPAIGTGANLGSVYKLILNASGTQVPYGTYDQSTNGWMRGAFGSGGSHPGTPVISSFIATPTSIGSGSSSRLSWITSGAASLSIDNGVGTVSGLSEISVSPVTTTTYTLTAQNSAGQVTASATVTVGGTGGGPGSHLYFRVLGTSALYPSIAEFEMYDADGNYLPTGGTASASSTDVFNGNPFDVASHAFDHDFATFWGPNGFPDTSQEWLEYAYASPVNVATARIVGREVTQEAPDHFKIQHSDDNSTWVDDTTTLIPIYTDNGSNNDSWSFAVGTAPSGAYVNWRVRATSTSQSGGSQIEWAEIAFRATVGGANLATSTSIYAIGDPAASNAFDGNTATSVTVHAPGNGALATGEWIGYAFPVAFAPAEICGNVDSTFATRGPGTIALEGSNDGGMTWPGTATVTFSAWTAGGQQQCIATGLGSGSVPSIVSFTATPLSIAPGGSSTLAWSVLNSTSLSINNGVGVVTGLTSTSVSPGSTTVYTLTATNGFGSTTATVTVTVIPPSVPVIYSFICDPSRVITGTSALLEWTTNQAETSLSINNGVGTVTGLTQTSVSPSVTTTYTITATNPAGSATASATCTVIPAVCPH